MIHVPLSLNLRYFDDRVTSRLRKRFKDSYPTGDELKEINIRREDQPRLTLKHVVCQKRYDVVSFATGSKVHRKDVTYLIPELVAASIELRLESVLFRLRSILVSGKNASSPATI